MVLVGRPGGFLFFWQAAISEQTKMTTRSGCVYGLEQCEVPGCYRPSTFNYLSDIVNISVSYGARYCLEHFQAIAERSVDEVEAMACAMRPSGRCFWCQGCAAGADMNGICKRCELFLVRNKYDAYREAHGLPRSTLCVFPWCSQTEQSAGSLVCKEHSDEVK